MRVIVLLIIFAVSVEMSCAPIDEDAPQPANEKNPVQEWFESLSKNATTGTQNFMNNLKEWFQHNSAQGGQNLPTMYMGSFQLLKMPMPQLTDVMQGMNNLGTAAQTINKLTGGFSQGLPLIPKQ